MFLPLKNGKILALDGCSRDFDRPHEFPTAEDGVEYDLSSWGMVELFDPKTGATKVLTRLPFSFFSLNTDRRQMKAIELRDGRIFLMGKFVENRRSSDNPKEIIHCKGLPVALWPLVSDVDGLQLKSIAPCTEPRMAALIYDYKKNTFEIINTPTELPPRYMPTLHLITDGKVLILGGGLFLLGVDADMAGSWKNFPEKRVLLFDPKTYPSDLLRDSHFSASVI